MTYGIVQWWLAQGGYSVSGFEISDTYNKTHETNTDLMFDAAMTFAEQRSDSDHLEGIKSLRHNRKFVRESKFGVASPNIVDTITSDVQEAFKNRVRAEVDSQLGNIDVGQKSRIRANVLGDFENINISDVPSIVEDNVREIFRTEVTEVPRMKEASLDIIGIELDEEDWVGLRYLAYVEKSSDARSQYLRISRRMRTL